MIFTLMNMRADERCFQRRDIQELYRFLVLTGGNYRTALYTECAHRYGYMLTSDVDLRPILFPIEKFYAMTGELPQKDEMAGELSKSTIDSLYRVWRKWNTESDAECTLCKMYEYQEDDEIKKRRC